MQKSQRADVLSLRRLTCLPWHSPPHRESQRTQYHITAACYEHRPIIGNSPQRMADFEEKILMQLRVEVQCIYAWVILPNHYHLLVKTSDVKKALNRLSRIHGSTSYYWNGEENLRGRKVWYNLVETSIKSDAHFWSTMNYIHHNPVHHGYVNQWQDWAFSSADDFLRDFGRNKAGKVWRNYPITDYGKDWDPPEM